MYSVLLTIHILVTLFLIGIILIQRSASDGMGLSSSSSTSFLSGRAAASAVTRTTAILATIFLLTSLGLGVLTARSHAGEGSILDRLNKTSTTRSAPLLPATPPAANPANPKVPVPDPAGSVNRSTVVMPATSSAPVSPPATPSVPRPE